MALVFVTRQQTAEPQQSIAPPKSEGFSYSAWYEANKQRLSEKRAKRYREDPEYREKAIARAKAQRAQTKKKEPVTDGYTVSFRQMAEQLGVTVWVLREWRRKNYFPEPHLRDSWLWFKPEHVGLLNRLKLFFEQNGHRVSDATRGALDDLVSLIYVNW